MIQVSGTVRLDNKHSVFDSLYAMVWAKRTQLDKTRNKSIQKIVGNSSMLFTALPWFYNLRKQCNKLAIFHDICFCEVAMESL